MIPTDLQTRDFQPGRYQLRELPTELRLWQMLVKGRSTSPYRIVEMTSSRARRNWRQPVEDIVQACAGWPLLLGAVVARVDSNRRTLIEVADEYRRRPTRLDILGDGIRPIDSRAVFDTSLNLLSDNAKRVFRLLSLRLGQDIDKYAVTLLAESDETVAARALRDIASVGLIIENGDHYTVHDVFHDYARERLDREETDEASRPHSLECLMATTGA